MNLAVDVGTFVCDARQAYKLYKAEKISEDDFKQELGKLRIASVGGFGASLAAEPVAGAVVGLLIPFSEMTVV